jgi:hypothetical protein
MDDLSEKLKEVNTHMANAVKASLIVNQSTEKALEIMRSINKPKPELKIVKG